MKQSRHDYDHKTGKFLNKSFKVTLLSMEQIVNSDMHKLHVLIPIEWVYDIIDGDEIKC